MSYPKIIEENSCALNKEKKFESHVPKMNLLSENGGGTLFFTKIKLLKRILHV
jgi:hypothetical protein